MPGKKSLTIGITVNLENYENLRLEMTGDVTDQQEVQELVGFLDQTLTTFGRGNPATMALIEKYRARVLSTGDGSVSAPGSATYALKPEPEWPVMEAAVPSQQPLKLPAEAAPVAEQVVPAGGTTGTKTVHAEKAENPKKQEKLEPVSLPEPAPALQTPPQAPASSTPAPVVAPVVAPVAPPQVVLSAVSCEICGCTVSSSEQKMSQLFMSRTLCKTCMKKA